jgi:murein DD-endopeptidase MepM/ murein hydrolase activator NlpD
VLMSIFATLDRVWSALESRFPERHLYMRTNGEMRGLVLTTKRQLALAAGAGLLGLWTVTSVVATVMAMAAAPAPGQDPRVLMRAMAERIEARQANLESLFATVTCPSSPAPAATVAQIPGLKLVPRAPTGILKGVSGRQDRLLGRLENVADPCAERLKSAFRQAGVDPSRFIPPPDAASLNAPKPIAIANPEESFGRRLQALARTLSDMRTLEAATSQAPFAKPTNTSAQSSGFGLRTDPFTGHLAPHPGLDFPAPRMTPVFATAEGVVAYAGRRGTYGNIVEIDHGHGLRTRFAHLAALSVRVGQHVDPRQQIGAIGSTGRSTGPHLHYEVWVDGQPKDPEAFLRAGDHVHQTG